MATLTIEYPDEILVSLKETKDDFSRELSSTNSVNFHRARQLSLQVWIKYPF